MRGEQAIVFTTSETPLPGPVSASASAIPPRQPKPLLSVVEQSYFTQRATVGDATYQVMGQERGTLRRFREVCGDRAIDAYGRGDVTRFLGVLRRLPVHYGKSPRDKDRTLAEIIAEADQKDVVRVSEKTVKRHLSALSQFFQVCFDGGYFTQAEWKTLVGNHAFRDEGAARDQRDQWLPEELVKLYGSPVWRGSHAVFRSQPGQHIIRDWRFWLPLLALFHGARLEEFADLRISDLGCDKGTWFFKIQEGEARRLGKLDQAGRKAQERRLKNTTATRVVPLHPELVRLGFLQHVDAKAPNLNDPLFPELRPQGKDRKRGARVTRWFGEYRKAVGVYREGVAMHAFRHSANTRLRDAMTSQQDERIINYLLGHIPAGGGEGAIRYDKGPPLQASAEVLSRLQFPELDLTHLYVSDG
jgi:integrase